MEVIVNSLHAQFPDAPIVAIAYSAGAHVLLTYLQVRVVVLVVVVWHVPVVFFPF